MHIDTCMQNQLTQHALRVKQKYILHTYKKSNTESHLPFLNVVPQVFELMEAQFTCAVTLHTALRTNTTQQQVHPNQAFKIIPQRNP